MVQHCVTPKIGLKASADNTGKHISKPMMSIISLVKSHEMLGKSKTLDYDFHPHSCSVDFKAAGVLVDQVGRMGSIMQLTMFQGDPVWLLHQRGVSATCISMPDNPPGAA